MNLKTIDQKTAEQCGYRPLTTPYNLPYETWMLQNAARTLTKDNIPCILVETKQGPELWRK